MNKKPKFDSEGYQTNIESIRDEPLPDLSKLHRVSRKNSGIPNVAAIRNALKKINPSKTSLRAAREKIGYTQKQFSEALGVNLSTYCQWEQGRRALTGPSQALVRIASMHPELVVQCGPQPVHKRSGRPR